MACQSSCPKSASSRAEGYIWIGVGGGDSSMVVGVGGQLM